LDFTAIGLLSEYPPENGGPVFTVGVFALFQPPQDEPANAQFPRHLVYGQTFFLAPSEQQFTELHGALFADEIRFDKLNIF
jgi:hypothetical protein